MQGIEALLREAQSAMTSICDFSSNTAIFFAWLHRFSALSSAAPPPFPSSALLRVSQLLAGNLAGIKVPSFAQLTALLGDVKLSFGRTMKLVAHQLQRCYLPCRPRQSVPGAADAGHVSLFESGDAKRLLFCDQAAAVLYLGDIDPATGAVALQQLSLPFEQPQRILSARAYCPKQKEPKVLVLCAPRDATAPQASCIHNLAMLDLDGTPVGLRELSLPAPGTLSISSGRGVAGILCHSSISLFDLEDEEDDAEQDDAEQDDADPDSE